jgi:hypothetical protein
MLNGNNFLLNEAEQLAKGNGESAVLNWQLIVRKKQLKWVKSILQLPEGDRQLANDTFYRFLNYKAF